MGLIAKYTLYIWIKKPNEDWGEISDEEYDKRVNQIIEEITDDLENTPELKQIDFEETVVY